MKRSTIISSIAIVAIFTGCKPSYDKSVTEIKNLETRLYSQQAMTFNKVKGDSLLKMYDDFISRFPGDSLSPVYLFRAANLTITEGDGNKSLALLDQFVSKFPNHPKVPVCLFLKAFVYENLLKNMELAKINYLLYIKKYPGGEYVRDAQMSVKNLGKTPEQMIREFEAMQKLDSVRKADSIANHKGRKNRSLSH
jgi:outer membrane protein assembly factor BamD (BamD/ComL family)